MSKKLGKLWVSTQLRMKQMLNDFLHEEKGAAEIVAIILIIVVIVAVVAIFKDRIQNVISGVFDQVDESAGVS
jgi:Flp pilus assembly pilin Flp